jgi:hypothetical protein
MLNKLIYCTENVLVFAIEYTFKNKDSERAKAGRGFLQDGDDIA